MKREKKKKVNINTAVQKENGLLLMILYGAVRVYYFLRGIRICGVNKLGKQPDKPAIVLCNHGSFIDFVYAQTLLIKSRPHFVAARLYFYHKQLGWLLRKLGCFPKSMFALDTESTKNCLRVLKDGGILAMMPEARLSTVGQFEDIQHSTFSFLKKAKVPVYTVKLQGDYFSDPKWGNGPRRGAVVEAELDILFTAEQLAELSPEQIRAAVEKRLYYDEFQWLATRPHIRYRSKRLAEGLENLLTLCPVCGEKYTVFTKGTQILCKNCGHLTALDHRYGFEAGFRFENFAQWYNWQKAQMRQKILEEEDFALRSEVELRLPGDGKRLTRSSGRGECVLDRNGLRYTGTKDGEQVDVCFPLRQIYRLLFGAGENFETYNGTQIWYFVPQVKQSAVDWYVASMLLYDETQTET